VQIPRRPELRIFSAVKTVLQGGLAADLRHLFESYVSVPETDGVHGPFDPAHDPVAPPLPG